MSMNTIKLSINYIYILLIILSVCGCNKGMESDKFDVPKECVGQYRGIDEVKRIALDAAVSFYPRTKSHLGNHQIKDIVCKVSNRSKSSPSIDTLYYVVNFVDNSGFAIISANRSEEALIAITEAGSYSGETTGNPGFDMYMTLTEERLRSSGTYSLSPDEIIVNRVDTLAWNVEEKEPLIDIHWHQSRPFNLYCGDGMYPAGCPAIAVAQAMACFRYPQSISLSFNGQNGTTLDLPWDQMISHITDHTSGNNNCELCHINGKFVREIGQRLNVDYDSDGSGINNPQTIKSNISSLGYTCDDYSPFNIDNTIESIRNNNPVIITGLIYPKGHVWNVFGYRTYYRHLVDIQSVGGGRPQQVGESISDSKYLYLNYGWNNDEYIGYFLTYHRRRDSGIRVVDGGVVDSVYVNIFDKPYNEYVYTFNNFKPL